MTPRFLIDTDACLRVARGDSPHFRRRLKDLQPGSVGLSVITYGELLFLAPDSRRLLDALPIVPIAATVAQDYANLRAGAARTGSSMGMNRIWLEAHARNLGATLVSVRTVEPGPPVGPRMENWFSHYDASLRRRAS